jgi:PAS domain-containing protein
MYPDKSTAPIDKSIDQDIAEYERQFREILEHCPAGLNVVDEDGRLLFHNRRIRELLGYSRDELTSSIPENSGMISTSALALLKPCTTTRIKS